MISSISGDAKEGARILQLASVDATPGNLDERVALFNGSDFPDHILVKFIDRDETPIGEVFAVAKPWQIRRTPFHNQVRKGILYEYIGQVSRNATDQGATQRENVTPSYVIDTMSVPAKRDMIDIRRVSNSGVYVDEVELVWQECSGQRYWLAEADERDEV